MPTPLSLGAEIATYLQGYNSGALDLNFSGPGTINLYVSGLPDDTTTPELAVGLLERGGLPPIMWLTGGQSSLASKLDRPQVQVRVRAPIDGFVAGNTLVNGIFGALQGIANTILNPPGGALFVLIMAHQSPVYLGRDERQRHNWSQNYYAFWDNDQR